MQTDPPKALLAGGAACVSLLAGGSSADATCPDDPSGPRHRTLTNCTASEAGVDVALTVYALARVGDGRSRRHTVPDGYCSDVGDSYSIEVRGGAGDRRDRRPARRTHRLRRRGYAYAGETRRRRRVRRLARRADAPGRHRPVRVESVGCHRRRPGRRPASGEAVRRHAPSPGVRRSLGCRGGGPDRTVGRLSTRGDRCTPS